MMKTLARYAAEGILLVEGWRALDPSEMEPTPRHGERVLLTQFLDRGLSLPIHPFIRDLFRNYGDQLHHAPPNGIAHLFVFISLCENFLGTGPHWSLWKHLFCTKPQMVSPEQLQIYGGLGLQLKNKNIYFDMMWPKTVKSGRNHGSTTLSHQIRLARRDCRLTPPDRLFAKTGGRPSPPRERCLTY